LAERAGFSDEEYRELESEWKSLKGQTGRDAIERRNAVEEMLDRINTEKRKEKVDTCIKS